jgi:hypothetical protein
MIQTVNPNAWSCLPAAFASALEVPVNTILNLVGHDGSEITDPDLSDPLCRRGFHPQEMIKLCLKASMPVTYVELAPCAVAKTASAGFTKSPAPIKKFDTGGWAWFRENLFNSTGVIECRTSTGGHAMAYEGQRTYVRICDPGKGGKMFNLCDSEEAERRDRFLVALWRIERIK